MSESLEERMKQTKERQESEGDKPSPPAAPKEKRVVYKYDEGETIDINELTDEERDRMAEEFGRKVRASMEKCARDLTLQAHRFGLEVHLLWEMTAQGQVPQWQNPIWIKKQYLSIFRKKKKLKHRLLEPIKSFLEWVLSK